MRGSLRDAFTAEQVYDHRSLNDNESDYCALHGTPNHDGRSNPPRLVMLGVERMNPWHLVNRTGTETLAQVTWTYMKVIPCKLLSVAPEVVHDEYTITLEEDAKPFAVSVPRKVPLPLYDRPRRS